MNDAPKKLNPIIQMIVVLYPVTMFAIGAVLNFYVLELSAVVPALPSEQSIAALTFAALVLLVNHTWLMTSTELTRGRYRMHATPEAWAASEDTPEGVSQAGLVEVQRRYNAHRNTTENVVYFAFLALLLAFTSPSINAVYAWVIGFAIARIAYTAAYLAGSDAMRGLCMSASLISLYGMASYVLMSILL
jgi:uncharacterized MAPEG superfamily protein